MQAEVTIVKKELEAEETIIEPGEDNDALIIDMYNRGLSYSEMSAELERRGCSHSSTRYVSKRTSSLIKMHLLVQRPRWG